MRTLVLSAGILTHLTNSSRHWRMNIHCLEMFHDIFEKSCTRSSRRRTNTNDAIAVRQLNALKKEHQGPRDKKLRLSDVKEMFLEMKRIASKRHEDQ
jgi:hypothetical protein